MSVFTNPASRSAEQTAEYTRAVLELVGEKDPLEILRDTPSVLEQILTGLSQDQLRQPENTGKWSIRHVLQHLADSELVWGYRIRMVIAHDRPLLSGYDQDLWADRLRYDSADTMQALHDFNILRSINLRLLDNLSDDDRIRTAIHAERGEESIDHMIRLDAGHDLLHIRQIERIRRAVATQ